jgi:hypothetical protein
MLENIVCTGIDCAILTAFLNNIDTQKYAIYHQKVGYLCILDNKAHAVHVSVFLAVNNTNNQKTHKYRMRIPKVLDSETVQVKYIGVSDGHGLLIPKRSHQVRTK